MIRRRILSVVLLALLGLPGLAQSERAKQFGDYQVHYNAIATGLLQPEVARSYGIVRSRNRGLITVAVLRQGEAVPARIEAEAINPNSQLRRIAMQEVDEGSAVYYIGTFDVDHLETLRFRLDIEPRGAGREFELVFEQRFYTDE
ncbi:DUF4426 domain-containing protein [Ectothiorhodospiraceae bacterium WFHF3C12]|nr:DUF4426 domain-containing protein [Ectothiorhodospiraceae bacterium WFHF3C12]